jgi:hypothetical protein
MLLGEDELALARRDRSFYRDRDGTIVVADFKTDASDDGAIAAPRPAARACTRARSRRALPHASASAPSCGCSDAAASSRS